MNLLKKLCSIEDLGTGQGKMYQPERKPTVYVFEVSDHAYVVELIDNLWRSRSSTIWFVRDIHSSCTLIHLWRC